MFMPVQMFTPTFWLQLLSSGTFQVITWGKFRFAELWILPTWPSCVCSTVCFTINEANLIRTSLTFHNALLGSIHSLSLSRPQNHNSEYSHSLLNICGSDGKGWSWQKSSLFICNQEGGFAGSVFVSFMRHVCWIQPIM